MQPSFHECRQMPWPVVLGIAVGIALLAPLLGLEMVVGTGYHDTQRWMQLVVLTVVAVLALQNLHSGALRWPSRTVPGLWLGLLAGGLGVWSLVRSAFPAHAAFEIGIFFFLFLAAWRVAAEVAQASHVRIPQALEWAAAGSLLYGFKALVAYVGALFSGAQPDPSNLIPGFDTFRFFNHGQTVTLPLIALLVCLQQGSDAHSRRWRATGWVALAIWWMLLLVSSGRGTWVGILMAMAVVGLLLRGRAWPWVRTMALGSVAGLVAYCVLYVAIPQWLGLEPFGFMGQLVQRSVENFGSSRGALWTCAVQMVVQHPWLGAGPLHYAQVCASLGIAAHPHNWVLQIAAEWGLLALGCIGAALLLAFRALQGCGGVLDERDERNQAMLTCWLATGIAIVLDGLVSGLLVMPVSQLWIVVYAGLAWGWVRTVCPPSAGPPVAGSLAWRYLAGVVILTMAGLLIVGVWATLASAHSADSAGLRLAPRAWGAGFFGGVR